MFPLGSALMPGEALPLRIFEPRYRDMLTDCIDSGDLRFGVVLIERGSEVGGGDVRTDIGTIAEIVDHRRSVGGTWALLCRGVERIRIDQWLDDAPYPRAAVSAWPDPPLSFDVWDPWLIEMEEASSGLIAVLEDVARETEQDPPIPRLPNARLHPTEYTYATASLMPITQSDRHRALSAPDQISRAKLLINAISDARAGLLFRLSD